MRAILFLISFFICFTGAGQSKTIKVKKPVTQDKMSSVVTIGGLYYGEITFNGLLADKKFRISNNKDNLKIIAFDFTFSTRGKVNIFSQYSDSLTPTIIDELLKRDPSKYTKIYISPIKAITSSMDTIFLNPIELKLIGN